MDFELAMTEPHGACGTRDEEWRDYGRPTRNSEGRIVYPLRDPPPYVAEVVNCPGCAEMGAMAKSRAKDSGGEMRPGERVILRRYDPAVDEADVDLDDDD